MKDHARALQSSGETPLVDWVMFWEAFRHGTAVVNGLHFHYVEGGSGAPILLLPGWPQSWYAWRYVMPKLVAGGHRVVAIDPRGMGDSDRPVDGYDLGTLAADIHGLVETLGLLADGPIAVAGHDIGTWIGYAYAADWPQDVKWLSVMDALVPGISSPRTDLHPDEANLRSWHFGFNRLDDLPEILLRGREELFLTWLFRAKAMRPWSIGPEAIEEYRRKLAAPGAIRTVTAYYKTVFSPEGLAANRTRAQRLLTIPILALGAERGYGAHLVEAMRTVATDVDGGAILGCGHYMPEEAPGCISDELLRFFDDRAHGAG